MAGVDFHAVKAGLARKVYRIAKVRHYLQYLFFAQGAHEGGGVQVESSGGAHGHTSAGGPVRHIAAVPQLDGCLCAVGVDGVREFLEFRDNLLAHPQLAVKGQSGLTYGGIGHGGHSHSAARHGRMIVEQVFGRTVAVGHILERRGTDDAVLEGDGPYVGFGEYL